MAHDRQTFLALFDDADPYDYIFTSWEIGLGTGVANLDYAWDQYWIWVNSDHGEWSETAFQTLRYTLSTILTMFGMLFYSDPSEGTGNMILDVTLYGALFNRVTAESIMSAWIDADAEKRLMTVLTLDELRREAWDTEFVSFRIAPAANT